MSVPLREGLARVDPVTRVTFAVLALASGVYTYLGVRDLLDGDVELVFFAAIIYSAAVSVGIYAFWTVLMRFLPYVRDTRGRIALLFAMLLGSTMIMAMSSWLNAAALAGSAAVEQHLATTAEQYSSDLDRAHNYALAAQSLLPNIQLASDRFARLAEEERTTGSLTGAAGTGTVVQLLTQMSASLDELAEGIRSSEARVAALFDQGSAIIGRMRALVSAPGDIDPRADAFAAEAVSLTGVVAAMQQTSVAPAVKRAAEDLSLGFIAPVAGGLTAELAAAQTTIVGNVEAAVAAQSQLLSEAADEILAGGTVTIQRFVPLSSAEAVIRYYQDFLPSWAGAISIDLLPAIIILILSVVIGVMHRQSDLMPAARNMTAADLMTAMRIMREVEDTRRPPETLPPLVEPAPPAAAPAASSAPPGTEAPATVHTGRDGKVTEFHARVKE